MASSILARSGISSSMRKFLLPLTPVPAANQVMIGPKIVTTVKSQPRRNRSENRFGKYSKSPSIGRASNVRCSSFMSTSYCPLLSNSACRLRSSFSVIPLTRKQSNSLLILPQFCRKCKVCRAFFPCVCPCPHAQTANRRGTTLFKDLPFRRASVKIREGNFP